jgi:iron complex outermembrane receptor protein
LTWGNQYVTGDIDKTYASGPNFVHTTNYGGALTAEVGLTDTLTLRSITAYRNLDFMNGVDADGSPLQFYESTYGIRQHQISQELQLLGKAFDNRLNYLFGAYYFDENARGLQKVNFAQGLQQINTDTTIKTATEAAFARASFKATDKLSFTLGGRITSEKQQLTADSRELNGNMYRNFGCYPGNSTAVPPGFADCQQFVSFLGKQIFQASTFDFPVAGDPERYSPLGTQKHTTNVFTWTGGADYHVTDKSLLYTSYSTGFKSGGWTTRLLFPSFTLPEFGPEKSGTAEVGFKSSFLQGRASTNLALFSTVHRDIQLSFIAPGFTTPVMKNVGTARINGAELEASAVVVRGLQISGSLAYLDAKYTELAPGMTGITLDSDLPKTPKWKASLSPQYSFPVFKGELRTALQYTYTSSLYNDTENTPLLKRPNSEMLNGSISYAAEAGWTLTAGGTNLTDERVLIGGAAQPAVVGYFGTYTEPRQWYLQLRVSM